MKINFYLMLTLLCSNGCLQASQAEQKENVQQQKQATPLELQMIDDAVNGTLTEEKLQQYLKQGADINANPDGYTALMWASQNGDTAIVRPLIAAGADINAKSNVVGDTALIKASINGNIAVVQQLITADADINAKNNLGFTALMFASIHRFTPIVQQLIAAGADQTIVNTRDDKTARDYAQYKDTYDKAVAAGLKERQDYLERQAKTKKVVAEQVIHISGLQDIIMGYAYSPSPADLPPDEEKKRKDKPWCPIQ